MTTYRIEAKAIDRRTGEYVRLVEHVDGRSSREATQRFVLLNCVGHEVLQSTITCQRQ